MKGNKTQRKAKFRVGQVVQHKIHLTYGRITGFDDGRYHVMTGIAHDEEKWTPDSMRPLTKRERGPHG